MQKQPADAMPTTTPGLVPPICPQYEIRGPVFNEIEYGGIFIAFGPNKKNRRSYFIRSRGNARFSRNC